MQAVVLAGGYATRLWPITKRRPKMLLPLGDGTVLDALLAELEAEDRIEEVYLSTNEAFASDFEAHLADRTFEKPVLSVEDTTAEAEKFGVVGALGQLIDREGIEDDLLVVAGDNVFDFAVADFLDAFAARAADTVAAYDVGSTRAATQFGVLDLEGDRVVDFQEKPDEPTSTLASIGCYAFTAETLGRIVEYLADGNNPDEPGWFVQWLQAREPVYAYDFDGAWFDVGTPGGYLDAVSWTLDGDARIAEDATIDGATVGADVHVMSGATVRDSRVESAVVFPEATVRHSELRNAIVDENALVDSLDLGDALVGAHSQVNGNGRGS